MLNIFSCVFYVYTFSGEVLIQIFCFYLVVYVLTTGPWELFTNSKYKFLIRYVIWNYFQPVAWVLTLSFKEQTLNFDYQIVFSFLDYAFCLYFKNIFLTQSHAPIFSSRTFIALGFIHSEKKNVLFFVNCYIWYMVWAEVSISASVDPIFPAQFFEDYPFFTGLPWATLSKIDWQSICSSISGLGVHCIDLSILLPLPYCLDFYSSVIDHEIR